MSAVFAGAACSSVLAGLGRTSVDRVSAALRVLLPLALALLPWPWAPPPAAQIVVFTASALWFAARVVLATADPGVTRPAPRLAPRLSPVLDATMAASAVWLGVVRASQPTVRAQPLAADEPGAVVSIVDSGGAPWVSAVSHGWGVVLAGVAGCVAVLVVLELSDRGAARRLAGLVAAGLTAAGMSSALLVLVPRSF